MRNSIVVLDTETTGLHVEEGHRIIEIGCVRLLPDGSMGESWQSYVNPERPVDAAASEIHGLTNGYLQDKPLFREVAEDFLSFIGEATLVIHNAPFDIGFLNEELSRMGKKKISFGRVEDTLKKARRKYPGERASLNALCKKFKISVAERTKHGALKDAELLAKVYAHMENMVYASLLDAMDQPQDKENKIMKGNIEQNNFIDTGSLNKKIHILEASQKEVEEHDVMLEKMGKIGKGDVVWKK